MPQLWYLILVLLALIGAEARRRLGGAIQPQDRTAMSARSPRVRPSKETGHLRQRQHAAHNRRGPAIAKSKHAGWMLLALVGIFVGVLQPAWYLVVPMLAVFALDRLRPDLVARGARRWRLGRPFTALVPWDLPASAVAGYREPATAMLPWAEAPPALHLPTDLGWARFVTPTRVVAEVGSGLWTVTLTPGEAGVQVEAWRAYSGALTVAGITLVAAGTRPELLVYSAIPNAAAVYTVWWGRGEAERRLEEFIILRGAITEALRAPLPAPPP